MSAPLSNTPAEKPQSPAAVETEIATDKVEADSYGGASGTPRTKTGAEQAAEKLYEERIEEEYAKREGGA